jgi:hypothetical protein
MPEDKVVKNNLVKGMFKRAAVETAITETNFEKAIGEDWLVGHLLTDEKVKNHL